MSTPQQPPPNQTDKASETEQVAVDSSTHAEGATTIEESNALPIKLANLEVSDDKPSSDPCTNQEPKQSKKKKKKKKGGNSGGGGESKQEAKPPREWTSDLEEDLQRILTVGEECISAIELKALLLAKGRGSGSVDGINLYDGFEPSGRMHIAQGVFKAMNVNNCTLEGTNSKFIFWVADWFALMNDKMGGDLEKIKIVGRYLIEVWKAAGMNLEHVEFKWASEEITEKADTYWPIMLDVARSFNITRIKKCCQIMGRLEGNLTSAQVLYPLMQCTDVFFLKADICQLGVDQRKVNMLAREYCDATDKASPRVIKRKPVILSHHMLYGLKAGQEKMSKSDPDSAVFMEDTAEDVERKIMNAYCPNKEENETEESKGESQDAGKESMHLVKDTLKNPVLDYIENIILSPPGATFTANDETFSDFASIRAAFLSGELSEDQLKKGLIDELNKMLEPVRDHFTNDENAKTLFEQVRQFKREGNTKSADKEIPRLNLVSLGKVKAQSHVVYAPLPSATPALEQAAQVLAQLKAGDDDRSKVLFLPDWTASVCNRCDGFKKTINAFFTIFVTSLKALEPELMKDVVVMLQSDAILSDPSNYWISVINAGRHFALDDVMGSNVNDADGVGIVIGRLMKVADIMGLEPFSIGMDETEDAKIESKMLEDYFTEKCDSLTKPSIVIGKCLSLELQQVESEVHKTENFEYFLLDDPKVHGKSKLKKAFCEPGNIDFCPPINMSISFGPSEIVIQRSPENGGDVTYKSKEEIEADFKSGSLHPGDLKATATKIMVQVLEKLATTLKSDGDANKAAKEMKAFQKKMSKKK
jgi:tyrosyl-tRNA synthetase